MLFRRCNVLLGLVLGSYMAAAAQRPLQQVATVPELPVPKLTAPLRTLPAPLPASAFLPLQNPTVFTVHFTFPIAEDRDRDHSLASILPIEHMKTVFVTESHLSFAQIWGGRLQLACFVSTLHTGNIVLGASAPSREAVRSPGHFDATPPVHMYGIRLSFVFGSSKDSGRRTNLWRSLSQVVGRQ
jgi:hypothetical protein